MWAMSSMLSSQSGSDDFPKPGCDGAIDAPLLGDEIEKGQVAADAAAAVQVEQWRALPALEQLKLDAGNRNHLKGHCGFR